MPYPRRGGFGAKRPRVARRAHYGRKLNERQKKQVKRLVGNTVEMKYSDTAILASPTAGGTVTALAIPAAGTGGANRIGDNITLHNVQLHVNFSYGDATNIVRFILFRWSQNNATTAPTVTDVLQYLNASSPLSHESVDQGKIHVMYDALITLTENGANGDRFIRKKLWGRRIGRKKLVFNPVGASTGTWMMYYLLISDSAAAPNPGVGGYIRYNFSDA